MPYRRSHDLDKCSFFNRVISIIFAALIVLLALKGGDAMANVKPEDFFTGDYLQFAKAVDREDVELMREIAKRINLNSKVGDKQMTVFVYAVANKKTQAMQELVKLGADPTLVVPGVGAPLSLSASAEDSRLIKALLDVGCDPNTKIDDEPLIFDAQAYERKENLHELLHYGADLNIRDSLGGTVLREAIHDSHYDLAILLIERGADVHAVTHTGVSVGYSIQKELGRMQVGSPGAKKLEKIIEMMKARGVKFPADPPPKK